MAIRFQLFSATSALADWIALVTKRWAGRFSPDRTLPLGGGLAKASVQVLSGPKQEEEDVFQLTSLTNASGQIQAGVFSYGLVESEKIIESFRSEKLYGTGNEGGATISAKVGDVASGLGPALATALKSGRVMQIVGPAPVMEGLANGTMTLMRSGAHSLGSVVQTGSTQILHQARFVPAGAVVAPLLIYQAVHMIVGTQQINEINRRLANIERTLDRIVQRQNARDLGEVIAATSRLRDILQEHQHSGHFNAQMRDRLSHCEMVLHTHLERIKLLKAQFHEKIQAAKRKSTKRDRAVELAVLIKEEGEQFGQDMRLLIALCCAVMQLEQGLMAITLEHHPESLAYRRSQMDRQMQQCREALADMLNLSEVQEEIRICLDEMTWWQKNLLDRSGKKVLREGNEIQLDSSHLESGMLPASGGASMLIWKDPEHGIQVRAVGPAQDPLNDSLTNPTEAPPFTKMSLQAIAPSQSLYVGEVYRLVVPGLKERIPIRILERQGPGHWLGMRVDTPDVEPVEIRVDRS